MALGAGPLLAFSLLLLGTFPGKAEGITKVGETMACG